MTNEPGIWEIAVLALLRESPMHPYQMQRLLRDRHKDEILALKRGSLYHAIGRLERGGLIAKDTTERDGRRPERTVYVITRAGRDALLSVLRRIVTTPRRESSEFMAAMSFLVHLSAGEAARSLHERAVRLEREIEQHSTGMEAASKFVARIHLVEGEYLVAMLRAELEWVRGLERDVREGTLDWDTEQIFREVGSEREAAAQAGERND